MALNFSEFLTTVYVTAAERNCCVHVCAHAERNGCAHVCAHFIFFIGGRERAGECNGFAHVCAHFILFFIGGRDRAGEGHIFAHVCAHAKGVLGIPNFIIYFSCSIFI